MIRHAGSQHEPYDGSRMRLRWFVQGYGFASCSEQLSWKTPQPDFSVFSGWVTERLSFPEATPGWYNIIREQCGSEREALDRFLGYCTSLERNPRTLTRLLQWTRRCRLCFILKRATDLHC
jgi:hypothetical protein